MSLEKPQEQQPEDYDTLAQELEKLVENAKTLDPDRADEYQKVLDELDEVHKTPEKLYTTSLPEKFRERLRKILVRGGRFPGNPNDPTYREIADVDQVQSWEDLYGVIGHFRTSRNLSPEERKLRRKIDPDRNTKFDELSHEIRRVEEGKISVENANLSKKLKETIKKLQDQGIKRI